MLLGATLVVPPTAGKATDGGFMICVEGVDEVDGVKKEELSPAKTGCTATSVVFIGYGGCDPCGALLTIDTGYNPGLFVWLVVRGPVNCLALNAVAMFNCPLKSRLTMGLLPPP